MSVRSAASRFAAITALAFIGTEQSRGMVMLGQVDTFSNGNSAFWTGGLGPLVIDNGGPAGLGDRYLEVTADGSGSGGKINIYNREQWLGDYLAAGVTAVSMDLRNFSAQTLQMRIAFKTGSGPTAPGYVTTVPVSIPNDGAWHRAVFPLQASAFTGINGPENFNSVLSLLTQEFRILHSTTASLTGNTLVGRLGVDNVQAIPAPSAAWVLGLGLVGFRRRRRG
jgi:hypothetical protein